MEPQKSNLFETNAQLLFYAGMWIDRTDRKSYLKSIICNAIYCVFGDILFNIAQFVVIGRNYSSLAILIERIGIIFSETLDAYKVAAYYYNYKRIHQMMRKIESLSHEFKPGKDFNPNAWIEKARKISKFLCIFFLVFALCVPLSNEFGSLVNFMQVSNQDLLDGNITCAKILPYYVALPNFSRGKLNCGFRLLIITIGTTILTVQVTAHDTLIVSLMLYSRAYLKIAQEAFKSTVERSVEKINSEEAADPSRKLTRKELNYEIDKEVTKCSKYLQTVIGLCEEIESCFTYAILGQTLVTLFTLSTCLFLVSGAEIFSRQFLPQVIYMAGVIVQLGYFCWFGSEITLATEELPTYMYCSNWLECPLTTRKTLLINMIRLQRPLHITAGKFAPLTLNTLVGIIKGGYSYYAMLKNTSQN